MYCSPLSNCGISSRLSSSISNVEISISPIWTCSESIFLMIFSGEEFLLWVVFSLFALKKYILPFSKSIIFAVIFLLLARPVLAQTAFRTETNYCFYLLFKTHIIISYARLLFSSFAYCHRCYHPDCPGHCVIY